MAYASTDRLRTKRRLGQLEQKKQMRKYREKLDEELARKTKKLDVSRCKLMLELEHEHMKRMSAEGELERLRISAPARFQELEFVLGMGFFSRLRWAAGVVWRKGLLRCERSLPRG